MLSMVVSCPMKSLPTPTSLMASTARVYSFTGIPSMAFLMMEMMSLSMTSCSIENVCPSSSIPAP